MTKFTRIFLLLALFIFITTFNPNKINQKFSEKSSFFKIKEIAINNNNIIKKDEILGKLSYIYSKNIFFVNKKEIVEPLKTIFFLKKVEVKKKYPNTIIINVYETKPVAIFFKGKKKFFLDNNSNLIPFEKKEFNKKFPVIFGENAEHKFVKFLDSLENNNFPTQEVKSYFYFKVDRWDAELLNGKVIKFPSKNSSEIIQQSVKLLKHKDFENYSIIDLRIRDKIIVE